MEFFLVGGAVRDKLLGLPVQDRDWVVVGATAETLPGRAGFSGVFASRFGRGICTGAAGA